MTSIENLWLTANPFDRSYFVERSFKDRRRNVFFISLIVAIFDIALFYLEQMEKAFGSIAGAYLLGKSFKLSSEKRFK